MQLSQDPEITYNITTDTDRQCLSNCHDIIDYRLYCKMPITTLYIENLLEHHNSIIEQLLCKEAQSSYVCPTLAKLCLLKECISHFCSQASILLEQFW